ncbi:MAG: type III pantothenate kinase [Thiotrichaceae bacterium]
MAILLIDIGNTRIKWADCEHHLGQLQAEVHKTIVDKSAFFEKLWGPLPRPSAVWVANVAGTEIAEKLNNWIQQRWQLTVNWVSSAQHQCGIVNDYDYPEQLGVDRWLAVLAARQLVPTNQVCVVDCGTAVTLDVLTQNHYIGGLIVPGRIAMQQALLKQTDALASLLQQPATQVNLLATNTTDGIQWGSLYAIVGLIRHLLEQLQQQVPETTLLLTGGGAFELLPYLPETTRYVPELVLHGLWTVANTSCGYNHVEFNDEKA